MYRCFPPTNPQNNKLGQKRERTRQANDHPKARAAKEAHSRRFIARDGSSSMVTWFNSLAQETLFDCFKPAMQHNPINVKRVTDRSEERNDSLADEEKGGSARRSLLESVSRLEWEARNPNEGRRAGRRWNFDLPFQLLLSLNLFYFRDFHLNGIIE